MKARNVKPGDKLQVPWSDDPIEIWITGTDQRGLVYFRGEQHYVGYWDPDDEVPIATDCPACQADIPRRDAK